MTMDEVLSILKDSERMGMPVDQPEGSQYIQLSDTLVRHMINTLEAYDGIRCPALYNAADKLRAEHNVYLNLPTDTPEDRNIKRQAHFAYDKQVYRVAYKLLQYFRLM
jgi:hypothetical protein